MENITYRIPVDLMIFIEPILSNACMYFLDRILSDSNFFQLFYKYEKLVNNKQISKNDIKIKFNSNEDKITLFNTLYDLRHSSNEADKIIKSVEDYFSTPTSIKSVIISAPFLIGERGNRFSVDPLVLIPSHVPLNYSNNKEGLLKLYRKFTRQNKDTDFHYSEKVKKIINLNIDTIYFNNSFDFSAFGYYCDDNIMFYPGEDSKYLIYGKKDINGKIQYVMFLKSLDYSIERFPDSLSWEKTSGMIFPFNENMELSNNEKILRNLGYSKNYWESSSKFAVWEKYFGDSDIKLTIDFEKMEVSKYCVSISPSSSISLPLTFEEINIVNGILEEKKVYTKHDLHVRRLRM